MQSIAVLLTCFNRKDKTLNALEHLFRALEYLEKPLSLSVYLTDDGSSDGTSEAVKANFPEIIILKGTGELFWAGGMRKSWNKALLENYDAYLLLNDDTEIFKNAFVELMETHLYCKKTFNKEGIYIGSTMDPSTKKITYGGSIISNRFLASSTRLLPNEKKPQECELGNANVMLVTNTVVDKIGILADGYLHGLADYDYTLTAKKNGIPVLIAPNFLGSCVNDRKNPYIQLSKLKLRKRIEVLNSPIGLDFKSNLLYMQRNFPLRWPFVFLAGWFKIIFPTFYNYTLQKRR